MGDLYEFNIEPDDPRYPGQINLAVDDPSHDPDHIDRRVFAVGYGIYLSGYHLYCDGMTMPIFLPYEWVTFDSSVSEPSGATVYANRDMAVQSIPFGAPALGKPFPKYAYFRCAGGMVAPTLFSPANAPRTIATILTAIEQLCKEVTDELVVLALSIVGGMVLQQVFSRILRVGALDGKIRPVNGKINVGGGLESGAESASNLQPFEIGTGGPGVDAPVPNLVRGRFEDIGEHFAPGSARTIYANRLPFRTPNGGPLNWNKAAFGSARVMAPGGELSLNVVCFDEQEVQTVIEAFTRAGFQSVRNETGLVGYGTLIKGTR